MSRVPPHVIEGRGLPFPQGVFIGRLAEVAENASDDNTQLDFALTLRDNTPLEGPQVGARPFTQRITVVYQNQSVVDIQAFDENTPFPLVRAAGLITQLAIALGAATKLPDGSADYEMESFLENLAAGFYKDRPLKFAVNHRPWKSKTTGRTGISAEAGYFQNPEAVAETVPSDTEAGVANTEAAQPTVRSLRSRK